MQKITLREATAAKDTKKVSCEDTLAEFHLKRMAQCYEKEIKMVRPVQPYEGG